MKSIYILVFLLTFSGRLLLAQKPYWQQELHYVIDVSLNDTAHTLGGFMKLEYINHSPDSLPFIWFHIWPNAYRSDQSAFSEQLLQDGRTDFYFADKDKRGYINRLDFRAGNELLKTEDHPLYLDIIKVILPQPLAPGAAITISTPFHVKLPAIFSRSGHEGQFYQVTQWYPKPAVYDREGWHPMPYLDQGEFYGEFGSYDVRITLPGNYVVAATGELQDQKERDWMLQRKPVIAQSPIIRPKVNKEIKKPTTAEPTPGVKTLRFLQDSIHDFAWFASKQFMVDHDTLALPSGKIINAFSYYRPSDGSAWSQSIAFIKDAIRYRSRLVGEYPYRVVSVVSGIGNNAGGMEYPTITVLSGTSNSRLLDFTIEHELGHNWFYGILASNERDHPWMDEGMNTYYDLRYLKQKYGDSRIGILNDDGKSSIERKFPESEPDFLVRLAEARNRGQAIDLPATAYGGFNYNMLVYFKTAQWMLLLEKEWGTEQFDRLMQAYYRAWQFRHPLPGDFKELVRAETGKEAGKNVDSLFQLLNQAGPLTAPARQKKVKLSFAFNLNHTDSVQYLNFFPAIGTNKYDGFMLGLLLHNYSLPSNRFTYALAPLYALKSQQFNWLGNIGYSIYPAGPLSEIRLSTGLARFSNLSGTDSSGHAIFGEFRKISPALRLVLREKNPRSTRERWLEWKTYFIGERGFDYVLSSLDSMTYPSKGRLVNRYLNQLRYRLTDYRALYPYDIEFQLQQGSGFYRACVTANYFLNYPSGGGAGLRFFAGKFGYIGGKTAQKEFDTYYYHPKLTAVKGYDDYTYSNYFAGRNENDGFASQQIMNRDAALKIRADLFQDPPVSSDDWVAAINLNTSLPPSMIPRGLPLKLFLDIGTYAPAWEKNATISRFLFVGGLQLSLFKNLVNIYAPLVYSKEFRNNLKSVPEENKFFKKLSFSIDLERFNLRRLTNNKIPL